MSEQAGRLPADTSIAAVRLRISDLDRALAFYSGLLELDVAHRDGQTAALAAAPGGPPLIELVHVAGTRQRPENTLGLYHFALLYPDRAAMAAAVDRLRRNRWPFAGFADHGVSEAAYTSDPDGNGIELYADRPREQWPGREGRILMYTRPLDLDDLLRTAAQATKDGAQGVRIGHIHLHVSSLELARMFYDHVLGFDVTAMLPGALFLAAGGYHHHLGANTWAPDRPQPPDVAGLLEWVLDVPDPGARAALRRRLEARGTMVTETERGWTFADPDGNQLRLAN